MNVLVTGGTGYIGSHTVLELIASGMSPIIVDNLSNSHKESLFRIQEISQKEIPFYEQDVCNEKAMVDILNSHSVHAVIHFAGYKAVGESWQKPLMYYQNNLQSTLSLLEAMRKAKVKQLVFSSSATVYGQENSPPLKEDSYLEPNSPYGRTKWMIEKILQDLAQAHKEWRVAILRYFNPVGAHPSGKIGEDPQGIPNNLMPFISQVAVGKHECLKVFGKDYETRDGTAIRDYIHVCDLAKGHVKAIEGLENINGSRAFNLGTGSGSTVLEVVRSFEKACGQSIAYEFTPRRVGDAAISFANCERAFKELNWAAEFNLDRMCSDSWRWQNNNPNGFQDIS